MISTGTHKRCYYVKVGATKGHTHTHTMVVGEGSNK